MSVLHSLLILADSDSGIRTNLINEVLRLWNNIDHVINNHEGIEQFLDRYYDPESDKAAENGLLMRQNLLEMMNKK